jgi:hypothetical protein
MSIRNPIITYLFGKSVFLFPALLLFISSCSNLRYLDEGQKLYTGSEIIIKTEGKTERKGVITNELENVLRPKPNETFLMWRPRLWFYNIAGTEPKLGMVKWIKNTLGRPPVLWDSFDGQRSVDLMENRLFNMGYFDAQVTFSPNERRKKASAGFEVFLKPPYTLTEIKPIAGESELTRKINTFLQDTPMREGDAYDLDDLKAERERIAKLLRDNGYFYFHPDHLIFRGDTTSGNRTISLQLAVKHDIPSNALVPYHIRNIQVKVDQSLSSQNALSAEDSLRLSEGKLLLRNKNNIRPSTLNRAVFFESGKLYNIRSHDLTINHLMGLGIFKFVNIRFTEAENQQQPGLDVNVLLTPTDKKSISSELKGTSKSNDFAGFGLNLSFNNRNFLGGAENFRIQLNGSYEFLLGAEQFASMSEAGLTTELTIPRFLAPFADKLATPTFIPKTRISLSFDIQNRSDAFNLASFKSEFGYLWNANTIVRHRFNPIVFNIFSLSGISPTVRSDFNNETFLRRGLFEQFIIGSEYTFLYNSQLLEKRKNYWYLQYNIDLSGNLLYLLFNELNLAEPDQQGAYSLWNQNFSQYSKTDFDLRFYHDLNSKQRLVARLAAGIGLPYGNSQSLPWVKLFTAGGSNSIRAFQPRSLGPGSFFPEDSQNQSFNIHQTGEIKLEMNLEYRFSFSNIVKGAVFADAGNIWNTRERENAPGGAFSKNEFLNQIALGTGAGLRFDFTFFILRFDLAFPLAVPYDNSTSYFQEIDFGSGKWRKDNLILNLAIGYPF